MSKGLIKVVFEFIFDFVSFCLPYICVGIVLLFDDNVFTPEQRDVLCSAFGLVFLSAMFSFFEYKDGLKALQKQMTNNIEVGK